jgi:hypothetical protein
MTDGSYTSNEILPKYTSKTDYVTDCESEDRLVIGSFCSIHSFGGIKFFMLIRCDGIGPLAKDYVSWLGMPDKHAALGENTIGRGIEPLRWPNEWFR